MYMAKQTEKTGINQRIDSMSVEEMKLRLAEYMSTDPHLAPRPVSIEVRVSDINNTKCRYDVLLIDSEGKETEIMFHDRYSRLIYIYTLMHPEGYQRRVSTANDYKAFRVLYTLLYQKDSEALIKTIDSTNFEHFFSHYVAQSRNAVRKATTHASDFAIDRPQSHEGKVLIPFVAQGGNVVIDTTLRNQMANL